MLSTKQLFNSLTKLAFVAAAGALVAISGCGGGGGGSTSYSKLVVFGASLSDTGNASTATSGASPGAAPNYSSGRWSNGDLWIENVAAARKLSAKASLLGGANYAYGGAKTCNITGVTSSVPDMCSQVTQYLTAVSNAADPLALHVIDASAVGNEINTVLGSGGSIATTQITVTAPSNVETILQRLYTAGARRFLVMNVPDVGATPLYLGYGTSTANTATSLSQQYNTALNNKVNTFKSTRSDVNVVLFDVFSFGSQISAAPAAYGLNNVNTACLVSGVICATPDTFYYWDNFHPTKATGLLIGNRVGSSL